MGAANHSHSAAETAPHIVSLLPNQATDGVQAMLPGLRPSLRHMSSPRTQHKVQGLSSSMGSMHMPPEVLPSLLLVEVAHAQPAGVGSSAEAGPQAAAGHMGAGRQAGGDRSHSSIGMKLSSSAGGAPLSHSAQAHGSGSTAAGAADRGNAGGAGLSGSQLAAAAIAAAAAGQAAGQGLAIVRLTPPGLGSSVSLTKRPVAGSLSGNGRALSPARVHVEVAGRGRNASARFERMRQPSISNGESAGVSPWGSTHATPR